MMRNLLKISVFFANFICFYASAMPYHFNSTSHFFSKSLTLLPGQNPECDAVLGYATLHAKFSYTLTTEKQSATAVIENPSAAHAPIEAILFPDGENDRYGFTYYYSPAMPFKINRQLIGLYGIILNLCFHGGKQAGVIFDLPSGVSCMMATPVWNYCR